MHQGMIYPFFGKLLGSWVSARLNIVRPTRKTDGTPGMQGELIAIGQSRPSPKGRRSHPLTHNEREERIVGSDQEVMDVEARSEWSSMNNGDSAQTYILEREVEVNVVSQGCGIKDEEPDWQWQLAAKFPEVPGEEVHFATASVPETSPEDARSAC